MDLNRQKIYEGKQQHPQMKIVGFRYPGGPNVLRIKEVRMPTLRRDEILIQVAAAGLNVFDTWHRRNIPFYWIDFGLNLGYECSGKVVAVGSDVIKFKKGDEVCAILSLGGGYAEFAVAPEFDVLRIPSGVSLVEAAALPEASRLIFFALSELVNLTPGKKILTDYSFDKFTVSVGVYIHASSADSNYPPTPKK
ncbi:quinone-oxidoreductase homolog, chloroplastic-like [Primulina eburnea]|uniref:quinone-oxidoreductase homolog, chloroplastic-like n=1 Tax=Primulina eburnea TaxID=1245227 RepID=UPI003C6C7178